MPIDSSLIVKLQSNPDSIRNICILAHVDHGKTSLSDNLLASNGVISSAMQGKIRYLDSRPDEQLRGITMESSAISLYYKIARKKKDEEAPTVKEYLINLIDSPGHIDFSSEVSTASRLCDGAIVVIDVVEGVCSQTVTVLRQSWVEKLKPILLLNKVDRLITELKLTPSEAYTHLSKLIEQANAVVGSFFMGQLMEDDMIWREKAEDGDRLDFHEKSDEDLYFAPEKNNVVFGSAIDGWGFNISQFASIYERKLGVNREKLEKVLWGDYFFDGKTKKVVPGKVLRKAGANSTKLSRPLFVQLVLENIWAIYGCTVIEKDEEKISKITTALDLKVTTRDLKTKDGSGILNSILHQWIPMSRAVLFSVIDILPSPLEAQKERIPFVLETSPSHEIVDKSVVDSMLKCDTKGPVATFIAKVISVPRSEVHTEKPKPRARTNLEELRNRSQRARELAASSETGLSNEIMAGMEDLSVSDDKAELEVALGFARVYSGTLKVGSKYQLLGPKYNPATPEEHKTEVTISGLYILMGRELILIDEAPAGSIVAIGGLDGKILKSGTLVSNTNGPNLASSNTVAQPILRVAVEPVDPTKIPQLERGLRLLNISDPCVQVTVNENGEHILATAGELHLERCIKDLKERFAKIEISYSKPVVPYREAIVKARSLQLSADEEPGFAERKIGDFTLAIKVLPLDSTVSDFLESQAMTLTAIDSDSGDRPRKLVDFEQELSKKFEATKDENFANIVQNIVAFGPRRIGPNILVDSNDCLSRRVFTNNCQRDRNQFEENVITGFQMAMQKGPLVAEPMYGIAVFVEIKHEAESDEIIDASLSGRAITATREGIYQAISSWSPRLMLATYLCDIQATAEVLGKVYGVISKRRGKILTEEMKEGTPFFSIHASIPVQEAFGFSEEIRKRTSGAANPQLVFSGYQVLDIDPFWVPTTIEELEDLGEKADRENIALKYVVALRKRKGLPVLQKLIENAERQRTMKR